MAIDSTASLLFNIGANSDDATSNIAKFRTLAAKDLSGLAAEFESWSKGLFGSLTSLASVATASFAALAAGAVAVGAAFSAASDKYVEYAGEISKGMKLTGLHAEQMSTLHALATRVGVDYGTLTNGLLKFSSTIVKASEGNDEAQKGFRALGISQKDVIAGQKDLYPLLLKVMDGFHGNASAVQKAAISRDLFSRGGTELLGFLSKGSDGLRKMGEEAHKLGLILSDEDVRAVREFKLAQKELKEQQEAVEVVMGKSTIGFRIWKESVEGAVFATLSAEYAAKALAQVFTGDLVGAATTGGQFLNDVRKRYTEIREELEKAMKAAGSAGDQPPPLLDDGKLKEAKENWYGISGIIEGLKGKIAGTSDANAKLTEEMAHYSFEIGKATKELEDLKNAHKITAEASARETQLLSALPAMLADLVDRTKTKILEASIVAKEERELALEAEHQSLTEKLASYATEDYDQQRAKFAREMDALLEQSERKVKLTDAEYKLLADIREAGNAKINKEQSDAFQADLVALQGHMKQIVAEAMLSGDRLEFEYRENLVQFSEVEEEKSLKLAKGEAARATVSAFYARNRELLTQKYSTDLQALKNSQGWQGVFGAAFAQNLQHNEALLKQWSQSSHQSILLVQVALESMRSIGMHAFDQFAQGMGSGIAQAIVYSKSIGDAMRSALAATLESIAGESFTYAIYATALGFLRLALGDPAGSAAAFTAAAIFGSVGAAAAVAGKYIAPPDATGSAAGASGDSASAAGGADATAAGRATTGTPQPTVIVNISGHVIGMSGAAELADILNQAVYGNDVTLYASHNAAGVSLGR